MGLTRENPVFTKKHLRKFLILFGVFCSALLYFGPQALAKQRLVLIGGGAHRPALALQKFSDWSGGRNGQVLVIAWASEIPNESAEAIISDLKPHFEGSFQVSLAPPTTTLESLEFLGQLNSSTGVFFSGGDQTRIMSAFSNENGKALLRQFKELAQNGLVMAGTSAGTAIMSKVMIAGDPPESELIGSGLGLLPDSVIVDQHFSQRSRSSRLKKAMDRSNRPLGIGIDEDTAVLIEDNRDLRVVGLHMVNLFQRKKDGTTAELHLQAGDTLNLEEWIMSATSAPNCPSVFNTEAKAPF